MRRGALFFLLSAMLAAPAAAETSASQFVTRLYADLARDDRPPGRLLWWRYLSTQTNALKQKVDVRFRGEELAYLDHDWLCGCQDSGGMLITSLTTAHGPSATTLATVRVRFPDRTTKTVRLVLVNEHGWKIADIMDMHAVRYTTALTYNLLHRGR